MRRLSGSALFPAAPSGRMMPQVPASGAGVARDAVLLLPFSLVGAGIAVVLAVFVAKGRKPARILVWLITAGTLLNLLTYVPRVLGGGYDSRKPAWFAPVQLADFVIMAIVFVIVSALLATPPSRAYFRHAAGGN